MRIDRRQALTGLAAAAASAGAKLHRKVRVFEARQIVTMSQSLPRARFMAVADGMVLGLSQRLDELAPWTDGREVTHDRRFADKTLFPGLVDPHIHPMQAAVMLGIPFLAPDDWTLPSGNWPGVSGQDAYRARLAQIVAQNDANPLIVWGHHELFHGPLGRPELDAIAPRQAAVGVAAQLPRYLRQHRRPRMDGAG